MTARRIISHLARAYLGLVEASRLTAGERPINAPLAVVEAKQAITHLVEAASLISPAAGGRVAEAARRAFDDAHRRAVSRCSDLDAHGLDEGGVAASAAEGTGGHVVDVVAGGADEERLHGGEHGTAPAWCECDAPALHQTRIDLRTMRALEDSVPVCSRCSRAVSQSGMVH